MVFRRRPSSLHRRRFGLPWRHVAAGLTTVGAASLFALTATAAAPPATITVAVTSQHSSVRTAICGRTRTAAVVRAGTTVRIAGRVTVTQVQSPWWPMHGALSRCGRRGALVAPLSVGFTPTGTFSKAVPVRRAGDYVLTLEFNGTNGERARTQLFIRAR